MSGEVDPLEAAELAWRETTLCRFIDPADRAALLRVGRMLHLQSLDQPAQNPPAIHAALRAAARDLLNLQAFFKMVWREGDDTELGASAVALTETAGRCAKKVGRIAASIEAELTGAAARELGRHRVGLWQRMRTLGIERPSFGPSLALPCHRCGVFAGER